VSAVDGAVPDERAQDLAEALRRLLDANADAGVTDDAVSAAHDHAERLLASLTYDEAGSASRQNRIDTGVYFLAVDEDEDDTPELDDPCKICHAEEAVDYGMCASCEHNARRSGWNPGDPD
jgi:hypothetical protein